MQLVHLLKLMSRVVDLEQQAVLAAHVDSLDLGALLERVRVIETVLEVQDCEDGVSGVVVEDNW